MQSIAPSELFRVPQRANERRRACVVRVKRTLIPQGDTIQCCTEALCASSSHMWLVFVLLCRSSVQLTRLDGV